MYVNNIVLGTYFWIFAFMFSSLITFFIEHLKMYIYLEIVYPKSFIQIIDHSIHSNTIAFM